MYVGFVKQEYQKRLARPSNISLDWRLRILQFFWRLGHLHAFVAFADAVVHFIIPVSIDQSAVRAVVVVYAPTEDFFHTPYLTS